MEGDRKAYSEESRLYITKQRAALEMMRREHASLRETLAELQARRNDRERNGAGSAAAMMLAEQEGGLPSLIVLYHACAYAASRGINARHIATQS